ncbi:hypothetical protein EJ04DRAFT_288976 [Polyplosphaeria fusca]|uniref:Uncharacterized protein n=1 Tax=Polyplosphaeria fusca TaxID=682080 RepID=A0A9P4RB21_9PLEO|nr:hypothetical protein EJ04DRAFT_288976 [Polyplosphaeria fusca]
MFERQAFAMPCPSTLDYRRSLAFSFRRRYFPNNTPIHQKKTRGSRCSGIQLRHQGCTNCTPYYALAGSLSDAEPLLGAGASTFVVADVTSIPGLRTPSNPCTSSSLLVEVVYCRECAWFFGSPPGSTGVSPRRAAGGLFGNPQLLERKVLRLSCLQPLRPTELPGCHVPSARQSPPTLNKTLLNITATIVSPHLILTYLFESTRLKKVGQLLGATGIDASTKVLDTPI